MKKRRSRYKSKLEVAFAGWLEELGWGFLYEPVKIPYTIPAKERTYLPDFVIDPESKRRPNDDLTFENLGGKIIIETKGVLDLENRNKLLYVKQCNPGLDIRLVFPQDNRITALKKQRRGRGMRYSDWCDKHGFKYHIGTYPPKDWFK